MATQSSFVRTATPGEMDQRIDLFVITQHRDDAGGVSFVKTPYHYIGSRSLWAKVTRQQGTEVVEAETPTAMAKAKIETRFVPGVIKTMIVAWQGIDWQIIDLDPQPREDRLFIYVQKRGESGDGDAR